MERNRSTGPKTTICQMQYETIINDSVEVF